jgi:rod shape-determining protein MreD|tara:strand:- start:158 stop:676 length:519 start_codon:yes stop_codon:yes gene_type:complete
MTNTYSTGIYKRISSNLPIILLFFSVLNEFDFNFLNTEYFSFNFAYILIFYYNLKKKDGLGYGAIFIAGIVNDVVVGTPIGLSSLFYLLICGAAAYLRNITLRPNLFKDWIFFLITLLVINSSSYMLLILFFEFEVDYFYILTNTFFTFFLYYFFSYLFNFLETKIIGRIND